MDDDAEQLDWGNDEEEQQHGGSVESAEVRRGADAEDAEDAVSLGGDEDEPEFYAYDARAQDNTPRGRASTPKSATIPQPQTHSRDRHHERERSMSSQRGRTSSYRQNSPQASPSLARSQSFGKLTHALPPKPVVSNVPFVHQPHLSTIEATAMVAKRHERANGKSDSADSLPPDWEVRRPSSGRGVYFYNLRTQESTWTRPGTKDKERGRSGKMNDRGTPTKVSEQRSSSRPTRPEHVGQPSTGDLSYEDRHYRPGGEPGNDGLVTSEITPSQVPDTPPRSPIIYERGRSPSRSRQRHSHRQLSLDVPSNDRSIRTDSARDPSRFTARSPDRRWAASREPVALGPSSASSRHRNVVSKMSPPPQEYRNYQGDVVSSSASRHRSPPPHLHEAKPPPYELQTVPSLPAGASKAPRKSRFERPQPPQQPPRDVYVPDDLLPSRRDVDADASRVEEAIPRRLTDNPASRSVDNRSSYDPALDRSNSTPLSPADISPADQSRAKKRQPLPPQRARFNEMAKNPSNPLPSPPGPPASTPSGPRDAGSPRIQPPPVRDANHPDFARGARAPPSGPSTSGRGRPRQSNDLAVGQHAAFSSRDGNAMDVDPVPSPAPDASIRANSGMYADREQRGDVNPDVLPTGPRAMAKNVAGSQNAPSASNSPTTPMFTQRSTSSSDQQRDVSPPRNEGWGPRRGGIVERPPPPHMSAPPPRHDPSWAADAPRAPARNEHTGGWTQRGPGSQQPMDVRQQDRRDVPNHPRPSTEFPPPPAGPHLKLSGTNSIPVGNRKYPTPPASQGPRPVLEPRRSFSSANAEPIRGPPPRSNPSMKESYDRPPQYNSRVVSPVEAFRPPRDADWRAPSASYEQHFERRAPLPPSPPMDLPSSLPPRPRGNSYRGSSSSARYAPMGHRESRSASPPRIWTPRKTSLSPPPRAAYPAEARYRDPTPPPPSADPSPRWEPSSYVAQNPPRDPERDHREHSRFNGSHHHNSMSPVRRKHEVNPMRPIDEDRRAASMSLEGRLSENYDDRFVEGPHRMQAPSMARRRTPELYREPLPMRQDYGRPDDVGERRSWNRSNEPEGPPYHEPDSQRSSKPVRIKRGPPMSTSGPTEDDGRRPEPVGLRSEGRSRSAQDMPPALQMGDHRVESRNSASLLERLSTRDGGSPGPPSLRDRVQVPTKRSREDMVEDPLGSMDVAYDGDEGLDGGAPRAKRRNPKTKPKRGRRVGAAS